MKQVDILYNECQVSHRWRNEKASDKPKPKSCLFSVQMDLGSLGGCISFLLLL